jgi:hypothetical protein
MFCVIQLEPIRITVQIKLLCRISFINQTIQPRVGKSSLSNHQLCKRQKEKTWKRHEDSEQKNTEASKVIWS